MMTRIAEQNKVSRILYVMTRTSDIITAIISKGRL